ncbi:MAG: O-antigen ligase family protein [Thiotrichales bacterium]
MANLYPITLGDNASKMISAVFLLLMALSSLVMIEPSPFDVVSLLLFVVVLLLGVRMPRKLLRPLFFAGLFLLGNIISFADVEDFSAAFRYMAISGFLFVIFTLVASLIYFNPEKMLNSFWRGYIIAAIVASLIGVLAFADLIPNAEEFLRNDRAKGFFKDPNVYGPYLIAPFLYLTLKTFKLSGLNKLLTGLLAIIIFAGLAASFSRGAIGNLVFATLLLITIQIAFTNSLKQFIRKSLALLLLLAAAVVLLGVIVANSSGRLDYLIQERTKLVQTYDAAEGGRFDTQHKTLIHGLGDPIGLGPGEEVLEFGIEPHNVYLYILTENGWLGFLGFTGFIFSTIILGIKRLRMGEPVSDEFLIAFVVVVSTAVQSLLIDTIHWRHFFFLQGVVWGIALYELRLRNSIPADSFPHLKQPVALR